MSSVAFPSRRPILRPLVLPTEHGGWGFLLEPLILALAVRPSWGGALIALAFSLGFLTRQPLKYALQDAVRQRSYPRTRWCWTFAAGYAGLGALAMAAAVWLDGPAILIPIGLIAPLGLTQVLYDANNRSRSLLPELAGAMAMASSAAAIATAGNMRILPSFLLSGIIVARAIPSIVFVRTLLHGGSKTIAIGLHIVAAIAISRVAPTPVFVAMLLLLARAIWSLYRPVPRPQTIGWREIAWGVVTVALSVYALT